MVTLIMIFVEKTKLLTYNIWPEGLRLSSKPNTYKYCSYYRHHDLLKIIDKEFIYMIDNPTHYYNYFKHRPNRLSKKYAFFYKDFKKY